MLKICISRSIKRHLWKLKKDNCNRDSFADFSWNSFPLPFSAPHFYPHKLRPLIREFLPEYENSLLPSHPVYLATSLVLSRKAKIDEAYKGVAPRERETSLPFAPNFSRSRNWSRFSFCVSLVLFFLTCVFLSPSFSAYISATQFSHLIATINRFVFVNV